MSRATRRLVVAHLTERGMPLAEIAAELGVSRDTVRRDLADAPPSAPAAQPEPAPPVAAGLLLPEGKQLRQDLNVLTVACRAQPEDVARFAIHQAAQGVRHHWQARAAARARAAVEITEGEQ
ncbi:helix-turn-helix domain-containing protein [Streptomyces sp. ARC32]